LRLSPFDPLSFHAYLALGLVHFRDQRYDDASAFCAKAAQANPRFSSLCAFHLGPLAMAGRTDEANLVARRLLELEPTFRITPLMKRLSAFARPDIVDGLTEGLRKAGLPE
jgi:adenylate cyclase